MDKRLYLGDSGGVFKSIQSAKAKWEKIGLGLGLSCSTLDQIRSDKHNEPGQCLYATLKAWINSEDKLAEVTWRALIRALAQVGETALAERLKAEKSSVRRAKHSVPKPPPVHQEDESKDEVLKMDDLMWLLSKLISVASNWFNFGLFLGIQFHELKTIEKKYAHDCNDCLRETLACWLKRNPTTGQLLKALNTAGESKLSRTLKQSFIQCDHRKETLPILKGQSSSESLSAQVPGDNKIEKYLRSYYCLSSQLSGDDTDWLPTLELDYVNLELVQQDKIPNFQHQLNIAELSRRGQISAALKQSKQLAFQDITNYSNPRKVIIIEGAPGVGKTTLAYKLCRDWANRALLTEFWLVLYIPLRVPYMRVAESADDLLQYYGEHCSSADIDLIKQAQGQGVLLILDGWDELQMSCRLSTSFFPRIIKGEFLPESSIIITSRPGAVAPFLRNRVANRLVEILGFTEDQVSQYIQLYFKDHKGAAEKLAEDLQAYPNVASTCYVAINLTILCYVYHVSGFHLPSTLTEVYEQFVVHAIKRHFRRLFAIGSESIDIESLEDIQAVSRSNDLVGKVLNGLGKVALEGLECGDLSFTKRKVTVACCLGDKEEFDGFGLLKTLRVFRRHGTEHTYHFLHFTVQEYLAANSIFEMRIEEQEAWLKKHLTDNHHSYDMVFKFFCGMDKFSSRPVQDIFSNQLFQASFPPPFILDCIFEGQWKEACQEIAKRTSSNFLITGESFMEPYRALVYSYVMTRSKTQWHLEWRDCVIGASEVKGMSQHLTSPTTLMKLSMSHSRFATAETVKLFAVIIQSQVELSELTLTRTQLDDSSLGIICNALTNHQMLTTIKLAHNELSESSAETISSLLTKLPSLHTLDVSFNDLGLDGCRGILQSASKSISLQQLYLPCKYEALKLEVDEIEPFKIVICFL